MAPSLMASDPEATAHSDEKPASIRVVETDVASHTGVVAINTEDESFWTRNGLNLTSFKKRHYGPGLVDLDRSMKTRHLNMIAIGGSIGAGFLVRSGGAFHRGGPASVLICFSSIGIIVFNVGTEMC